jgi:hypothetical protein
MIHGHIGRALFHVHHDHLGPWISAGPRAASLVQHFKLCDQREWLRSFLVGGSHPPFTVMLQLGVDVKPLSELACLRAEHGQRGENVSAAEVIRLFRRWDIQFRYLGHLYRIYLDNLESAEGWTGYPTISRRSTGHRQPRITRRGGSPPECRSLEIGQSRPSISPMGISTLSPENSEHSRFTPGSMRSGWINFKTYCWYSQPLAPI